MKPITECRVCCSKKLEKVGSLGNLAISTFTRKPSEGQKMPLELVSCRNCTLIQLRHNPPQKELYKKFYWYKSGLNSVIKKDLQDIVKRAIELSNANDGDIILDIGSNDSTLLRSTPSRFIKIGVEPAENLWREAQKGVDILIKDFWSYEKFKRAICKWEYTLAQGKKGCVLKRDTSKNEFGESRTHSMERQRQSGGLYINSSMALSKSRKGLFKKMRVLWSPSKTLGVDGERKIEKRCWKVQSSLCSVSSQSRRPWKQKIVENIKAKVITAIGMFYDTTDPNEFIQDVSLALADDGIFIAQLMTLEPMLAYNDLGNICHEHLEYYTYKSLVRLYEQNGLEIFKVEKNRINGGSYRLFARKYSGGSVQLRETGTIRKVKAFFKKVQENKEKTVSFIRQQNKMGKKVYGYGASTKGNTILQWYGLTDKDLIAIADKNPEKHGLYTVRTKIPIVSEEEARKDADYFFVLPWGFLNLFVEKERGQYNWSGKFIISIPKFAVL